VHSSVDGISTSEGGEGGDAVTVTVAAVSEATQNIASTFLG